MKKLLHNLIIKLKSHGFSDKQIIDLLLVILQ